MVRHMKNVQPALFGPYRCNQASCGKLIESGVKMVSHMNHHSLARTRDTDQARLKKKAEVGKKPSAATG